MTSTEFSKIISETKSVVLSAIRKNLAERFSDSIDDVVQEVYIRAYKSLSQDKFRKDSSISTWLYTIARNESLRMNEKLIREEKKVEKLKLQTKETYSEVEDKGTLEKIKDTIGKIPAIYSSVLIKLIEGKSEKKIAEELAIAQGTVKSRISRGKQMIKDSVKEEEKS
jgi:RNA polymerase sigma-70 factor (ECF subfamily)